MATTSVESSALAKRSVAKVGSAWVRRTVARAAVELHSLCRAIEGAAAFGGANDS